VQVTGPINYGGTLAVTKIGPTTLSGGDSFQLFSASGYSGTFGAITLPTLVAGQVWTNKLAVDGSLQVVGVSAPHIGNIVLAGTNLVISGTGGPTNGTYWVLASTNIVLSLTNWPRVLTNQFNASGNFIFTNAISPIVPWRFYVLQVP